jgi:hypothetical protein
VSEETAKLLREILQAELHELRANVSLIRTAQIEDGKRLAALDQRCADRRQHCSEEFKRLGSKAAQLEDTGVHNLVELQKRAASASTLRAVVKYVVVALGAAGTVVAIWASVASSKATTHHRAPAAVVDARR